MQRPQMCAGVTDHFSGTPTFTGTAQLGEIIKGDIVGSPLHFWAVLTSSHLQWIED